MKIHSLISVENRSIEPLEKLIKTLITGHNSKTYGFLQKITYEIYKHMLMNKHSGQSVDYALKCDNSNCTERISLLDNGCFSPSFFIEIETQDVSEETLSELEPLSLRKINKYIRHCLTDVNYSDILFRDNILKFLLCCTKHLNATHCLEFEASTGALYFKATPRTGGGSITVLSQSAESVILANDISQLEYKQRTETNHEYH